MDIKSHVIAEIYLQEIIEIFKEKNVLLIVLFGSMNDSRFDENSDIDLFVVLDIDKIPETYEEKMELKSDLRKSIRHINREVAIDLIVYTKKEYEFIQREQSPFLEEIVAKGKTVYEKAG